ncbi:phospholipase A1 member A [Delphinapterus leucas]|uniref:Phospholipase A1 member A n=1 Tax=Delphinapterus leucas TaxID=9749 RepID=A0A2Y9NK56_DELLE|nr:phospholipase A1 member A [Delphinapterus leucas]
MAPDPWEGCFWSWGLLLWLSVGSTGDAPPTPQTKCTDFQNANLLQGTNLKAHFLLFTPSDPLCGQLVEESSDIRNLGFNVTLGTKLVIHGFRWEPTNQTETFVVFFLPCSGYSYLICDHMRAVHIYISALENSCPLMAFPCTSYKVFLAGHCLDCFNPFLLSCPRIGLVEQGGVKIEPLPKEVKVYLLTTSTAPYCVHHSLVEFYLLKLRNQDTCITVTFLSSSVTSSVTITIPRQQRHGKGIIAHPSPQCQINQVKLKFQPSNRVWKKDRTIVIGMFCTAPLPVHDNRRTVCLPEPVNLQASETVSHDLKITCI